MPELAFPLIFECSNCDAETTVERAEAHDMHPDPDSFDAIHLVLEDRGWVRDEVDYMIWCPDCIPDGPGGSNDGQDDEEDTGQLNVFRGR